MTTRQVSLEVNGKMILDADVSKAEQKVKQFTDTIGNGAPVPGAGTGGGGGDPRHAPPAPALGQYGYNAQRATDSAEGRLNQARTPGQFRDVSDQLERALGNATIAGNKALVDRITRLSDELGKLQGAMEKAREQERTNKDANQNATAAEREARNRDATAAREARLQAEEAARQARRDARLGGGSGDPHGPGGGPAPAGGGGILNHIGGWLQQQGQSGVLGGLTGRLGGPLGSLLGGLGGKLLGGPLGMAVGGLSAANYAFNAVSNGITEDNAPARNEIMGNADLARQYGSTGDFMFGKFRDTSGWTNKRFSGLGYSATQAAHVAAVYDRPGGMMNDTESILKFSRTMGVDETRTAAAARTLGLAGIGGKDGGNVGEGLRTMKLAMSEGIKMGIASSDTMNSLLGIAQKAASEGRSMGAGGLAYYAALGNNMNKTGDVALKGASGMNFAQGMLEGFGQQGGDPGMEMMLIQGMGKLPDAKTLGLKGGAAKAFDQMKTQSPVAAARYMLSQLKKGDNPALVDKLSQTIDAAAGDNVVLKQAMYKQINPGASDEQIMDAIGNGGLSKLMHVDGKTLNTFKNGAGSGSDVQGKNGVANSTMYLRVADADRDMLKSISSLKLFGGLEETFADFKNSVADFRASIASMIGGTPTGKADFGGTIGQGGRNLTGGHGTPGTNAGLDLPYTPEQAAAGAAGGRTLAAMARVESTNGKNPQMDAGKASGLFQILGGNVVGKGSWAKQYLGIDTGATNADEGKAWLRAHPEEADKIGAAKLNDIRSQIQARAAKDGLNLNDNQLTGMTGVLYHRNGGSSMGPLIGKDGKLNSNPYSLSRTGGPDGQSDYAYYNKVSDAFGSRDLKAAAMRGGDGTPQKLKEVTSDMVASAFQGAAKDPKVASACAQVAGDILTALGFHVKKNNNAFQFQKGLTGDGWAKVNQNQAKPGDTVVFRGTQYGALNDQGTRKLPGEVGTHIEVVLKVDDQGRVVTVGNNGQRNVQNTYRNLAGVGGAVLHKGYASGGYTGGGGRDEVAGQVHGQEFVVNANATARYRSVLEGMNSGAAGGGMTLTLSGTVQVNVALSGEAQSAIQQEFRSFQTKAGRIAAGDIQNKRGIR